MCDAGSGPFGAQTSPALDSTEGRKQLTVDLADVLSFHPSIDMEAVGRLGDYAPDKLFEQRPDRGGAVRADICNEMESGVSHCATSSHVRQSVTLLPSLLMF
jgi:hypothetical protein